MQRFLLILVSILLCTCSVPSSRDEVVIAIDNRPQNLDPRIGTDISSQKIHQLIFHSLFVRETDGGLKKELVEEVRLENDRQIFFSIRQGVTFHNGKPLTAADVVFTYRSLLDPEFRSFRKSNLTIIDRLEVLSRYEFRMFLKAPFGSLYDQLMIGIIPDGSSPDVSQNPVGSGPYRFENFRNNRLRLSAFRNNGDNRNNFEHMSIKIIPDPVTRVLELRKGDVDISINDLPLDSLAALAKIPRLKISAGSGSRYTYLAFNLRDARLNSITVRRAIAYAVDREKIVSHLLQGYGRLAETPIPTNNLYHTRLRPQPFDPRLARNWMSGLGYSESSRLKLEFKCSNSGMGRELGLILRQQLSEIFIDLQVTIREFSSFYADIKAGNFQMYALTWVGINDPDILYYLFHSENIPPRGANRGFYINPEVDQWIVEARNSYSEEFRRKRYDRIQARIRADLPYLSLWYDDNIAVVNRRISGFEMYSVGEFFFARSLTLDRDQGNAGSAAARKKELSPGSSGAVDIEQRSH